MNKGAEREAMQQRRKAFDTKMRGLGDLVAAVATPVAAALGLDCVDPATGRLKETSDCAKRRDALNAAVPFKKAT